MSRLQKIVSILIGMFVIQTLGSCIRCDDPKTYNVNYQSVNLNTFDTSGFNLVNSDSAHKNAFAIIIDFNTEEIEVSDYRIAASIGFNAANAWSCPDDSFIYEDKISDIQIIRIEEDGTEINMTGSFSRDDYNGNRIGITDMLHEMKDLDDYRYYRDDSFHLELHDYKDVPGNFKLRVEVSLDSGAILTQETGTLYFVD